MSLIQGSGLKRPAVIQVVKDATDNIVPGLVTDAVDLAVGEVVGQINDDAASASSSKDQALGAVGNTSADASNTASAVLVAQAARDAALGYSNTSAAQAINAAASADRSAAASNAAGWYPNAAAAAVPAGISVGQTYYAASPDGKTMRQFRNTGGTGTLPTATGTPDQITAGPMLAILSIIDTTHYGRALPGVLYANVVGGKVIAQFNADLSWDLGGIKNVNGKISAAARTLSSASPRMGYAWMASDPSGKIPFAADYFGDFWAKIGTTWGNISQSLGGIATNATAIAQVNVAIGGNAIVSAYGDSLTAGANTTAFQAWPFKLATALGRTVNNLGISGQTSTGIAERQGGRVVQVTLASGLKLAATGAQNVTVNNSDFATGYGSITGSLAGVHGSLGIASGTQYAFTPDAGNTKTPIIPPATPFWVDVAGHDFDIQIIGVGRNTLAAAGGNAAAVTTVLADIAAMVSNLKAAKRKFIIWTTLNASNEYVGAGPYVNFTTGGEPTYNLVISLNQQIMALYPYNAIDMRKILVNSYNPALAQDVIDFGRDCVPTSIRTLVSSGFVDYLHPSDSGHLIMMAAFQEFITRKGW